MSTIRHGLLVFNTLLICLSSGQETNGTEVSGNLFGRMTLVARAANHVGHMESDLLKSGNLLFSDGHSLKTTGGTVTADIIGSAIQAGYVEGKGNLARFYWIFGFTQLNKTHVVVVDSYNHCIRMVNRESNSSSPWVGTCRRGGYQDGNNALFNIPWGIIKDQNNGTNRLILTDSNNQAIRTIDIKTKYVGTLLRKSQNYPTGITFDTNKENMFISNYHYITMFHWKESLTFNVTGSLTQGYQDGRLANAKFNFPSEIIALEEDKLVLADMFNHRLRIINLKKPTDVSSICYGPQGYKDGDIQTCQLVYPRSLLYVANLLFVGQYRAISRMKITSSSSQSDNSSSSSSSSPVVSRSNNTITTSMDCPADNITIKVPPGKSQASLTLISGIILHYSPGIHKFTLPKQNCTTFIHVLDEDQLRRRLDIEAVYNINCSQISNSDTVEVLVAVAYQRYQQIEELCSGKCKKSSRDKIAIRCNANNSITVSWPTDLEMPPETLKLPDDVLKTIHENLKIRKKILDLILYNNDPPVIYPQLNENGFSARVVLSSVCTSGYVYDKTSSTCKPSPTA